jgi:cyanophycinase
MRAVDAMLLERASGTGRTHVVVIPTASVPDGPGVVARWSTMGERHFTALGATVDVIPIGAGASADDPTVVERVGAGSLVYFSGGKPDFLLRALRGTPVWSAALGVFARGGVIAGCSAGAMVLGAAIIAPRLRWPLATEPALGLVPDTLILPHYDALPAPLRALASWGAPARLTLIGIDEDTALVGSGTEWQVLGQGGVEVRRAGRRERYASGALVTLGLQA